jgi:hypothetical protein
VDRYNNSTVIRKNCKRLGATLILLWVCVASYSQENAPQRPNIPLQSGPMLVSLARQSMKNFLSDRLGPEEFVVPTEWKALTTTDKKKTSLVEAPYAVCVTLRKDGAVVGRSVQASRGLVRNVVAAALKAMRGPALPDRITSEYLSSLVVELEILGSQTPLAEEEIPRAVAPGRLGLRLSLGVDDPALRGPHFVGLHQEAVVLPSTAYVLGWDTDRMRKQCLLDITFRPENRDLPRRWTAFATLHYIGYPEGGRARTFPRGTWLLVRGKILRPPWRGGDKAGRLAAARQIGDFLLRCRQKDGRLVSPTNPSNVAEELYAAWALTQLAAETTDGRKYTAGAQAVLAAVKRDFVQIGEANKIAWVSTSDNRQDLLATGLFLLALVDLPADVAKDGTRRAMAEYLRRCVGADGRFRDVTGTPADAVSSAVALLAMQRTGVGADVSEWTDALDALLLAGGEMGAASQPADKLDTPAIAWLGRAILAAPPKQAQPYADFVRRFVQRLLERQVTEDDAPDEAGAIRDSHGSAMVESTGPAAVLLAEAAATFRGALGRNLLAGARQAAEDGRGFCGQMIYQPEEAYFIAQPYALVGAVRCDVSSARVSLSACAAALEALLAD